MTTEIKLDAFTLAAMNEKSERHEARHGIATRGEVLLAQGRREIEELKLEQRKGDQACTDTK